MNSGSVYRAIAKNVVDKGVDSRDVENVIKTLEVGMIKLLENDRIELYGNDVSHQIRADYISQITPNIAKIPEVQPICGRLYSIYDKKEKRYIIDGRDTTFKIMLITEVKGIFMSWGEKKELVEECFKIRN
ncbi:(d)CMP kinase [Mycoplasmopsis cynos]|nr:(d)CMP kinase [Mycoplasmopsis cynos]